MYIRPVHAELDPPTLYAFVEANPLGLLTTHFPHPSIASLQMTHIPFVLDRPPRSATSSDDSLTPPSLGVLRGHMARANPQSKALLHTLENVGGGVGELEEEVLVLFNADVRSYVTPAFYKETKPSTGKVVPTFNYAAVQVYGKLRVIHATKDDATGVWLQSQLEALTDQEEARRFPSLPSPTSPSLSSSSENRPGWKVTDAPSSYVELLKKAIVGLEITITRIEGRFKLSQETQGADWEGVVEGFKALGTEGGMEMGKMVEARKKKGEGSG